MRLPQKKGPYEELEESTGICSYSLHDFIWRNPDDVGLYVVVVRIVIKFLSTSPKAH